MKIAIMQPYLFPYLGYFQLIHAVDVFVFLDDVQFIKRGWINRNKILFENREYLFSFNLKRDLYTKLINQRRYSDEHFETFKQTFFTKIIYTYKNAPYFSETFELLSDVLNYSNLNVAAFNANSLKKLCEFMGINTKFLISSDIDKKNNLNGQEHVIEINRVLASDCYINPIGGIELYSRDVFREHEIMLKFIKMNQIKYPQFESEFVPSLSIIDVLMFNSKNKIKELLNEYELI